MQTRSPFALALAFLALTSCGDDGTEGRASPDGGSVECPTGPQAPLGFGCSDEGRTCRYGYDPPACGGRTVICRERRWEELEHTDPQLSCFDGGVRGDASLDASGPSLDAANDAQTSDGGDASSLCQPVANGSGCSYVRVDGTATVTALETPAQDSYSCKNGPVTVRFTFVPDDPARAACFRGSAPPNSSTFRVGAGANPPRACIEGANVRVGSELRVTRQDLVSGTCSPVVYTFPTSLTDACMSACMF